MVPNVPAVTKKVEAMEPISYTRKMVDRVTPVRMEYRINNREALVNDNLLTRPIRVKATTSSAMISPRENGLIPQYELHQCGIACHACGCQSGNGQSKCHPPIDIAHEFGKHGSLYRLFRVISIYVFSFHYVVVVESRVIY